MDLPALRTIPFYTVMSSPTWLVWRASLLAYGTAGQRNIQGEKNNATGPGLKCQTTLL